MNQPPVRIACDPQDEAGYRTLAMIPPGRRRELVIRLDGVDIPLCNVVMADEFEGVVRCVTRHGNGSLATAHHGVVFEVRRGRVEIVLPRGVTL